MNEGNISINNSSLKKEFSKNVIISLIFIGTAGLILRILFLHEDLPLISDNFLYFRYSIDLLVGYDSPTDVVSNNGWSLFLYPFFAILNSNNFIDYMILQKYLSVILSVLTIFPIYFLCRQFFDKQFSLIGSAIFIFEPRIIQNSLFGITEPLYLIALTTSMFLFLSKKNYLQYASFAFLASASVIRSEALFIIPIFYIIFFIKSGINKKTIVNLIIISCIVISVLLPVSILRNEQMGTDGLTDRISSGVIHVSSTNQNILSNITSFFVNGFFNMIKFLGWSQIPYFILFVPIGFMLFLKDLQFKQKTLLVIGLGSMIPALYAYSVPALDSRYLFALYPIFCVISLYSIRYYFIKFKSQKIFFILIFSIILSSSIFYLIWKDIDYDYELEAYNLAFEVSKIAKIVNAYPPESSYLPIVSLTEINDFPIKSEDYIKKRFVNFHYDKINSLQEMLVEGKKIGMTHLVIDEKEGRAVYLKEIFNNEEKYPYLIKEFDSKTMGYEYHLKVFKIDYEKIIED